MATLKSVRTVDKTAQHRSYLNRRWRHRTTKTTAQTYPDAETKTDRQTEYRYWEFRKRFNILETLYTDQFDDIGGPDGGHKEAVYGNDLHASLEYVRWLCRKYQGRSPRGVTCYVRLSTFCMLSSSLWRHLSKKLWRSFFHQRLTPRINNFDIVYKQCFSVAKHTKSLPQMFPIKFLWL